ncbi:sodium/proline symporter PutP [Candidatus Pantoea edessiphila]|uniref:Sodium/proline symporter n=1 Tax=Candidatus Pantoea edessiphila TaxID=2044610 RepID=A0A2P5SYL7_9GAMM|nr:sodium/proline symporter PutP [Candidatus Pantoea edessiphila]MBK4775448.1 sodium/proline symporter PutP [Pantoea sp. Edef]PPI87424.1 sodium/proline symporter PutP [Candidatus Pantoea edessiphila]
MTLMVPMVVTFVIYIFAMIIIGFIGYYSTKNFNDYILGGRRLGSVVTALSAGASDMSGWLLMGLPGAIFISGISESWIAIGLIIGAWLNWKIVASRLRLQTEHHNNALTLPDFFANRFEDHSKILRVISAIIILVFFTIYCSSGIVAGARLFETTFHVSYKYALIAGAITTIIYTLIGGFLAVSWTDTVQASLMIFALILTPITVIISSGGLTNAFSIIEAKGMSNIDMLKDLSIVQIISLLGWGLGYFGQPHILARFMAAKSHRSILMARRISMTWMILCLIGAISVGFFSIAYFENNPEQSTSVIENSERVFIEIARILFNPWISGILLSAILAAIMSTLSCQLLVCSSALTEDLYKSFLRTNASQKELVWVGRFMVLLIAIIAIILALDPNNLILSLVSYAWAGFGAAFGPVVLFSVCWRHMNRNGALAGMIVGALTVLLWKNYGWTQLYEIVPGFIFSSIAIIIFSFVGDKPSSKIIKRFDNAVKIHSE